jgi:hypothetical protein
MLICVLYCKPGISIQSGFLACKKSLLLSARNIRTDLEIHTEAEDLLLSGKYIAGDPGKAP